MSDDYRPREHDHLVEPMFGGLGVERERPPEPGFRGWLRRLWRRFLSLVRPSRPGRGP